MGEQIISKIDGIIWHNFTPLHRQTRAEESYSHPRKIWYTSRLNLYKQSLNRKQFWKGRGHPLNIMETNLSDFQALTFHFLFLCTPYECFSGLSLLFNVQISIWSQRCIIQVHHYDLPIKVVTVETTPWQPEAIHLARTAV